MNSIPNRRQRRAAMKYQGVLKAKSKLPFAKWTELIRETNKQGKEIFETNRDAMEKSIADQLEQKELAAIESWKEQGYDQNEIEKLREAWAILTVRDMETWHTDKKVARKILKETRESLHTRKND
jgi:hypothetical protein